MGDRTKPVDWDELYPGRFIKAGMLRGRKATVTIAGVDTELLEGDTGKKVKGVISLEGKDAQWCLNKTNGICLREMFGRQVQGWVGKRVTIHAEEFNGEPCIRVWGSPDIERDMAVQIQLPRKKAQTRTLHKVGPTKEREPGSDDVPDHDPDTGEVRP